ncbi:hypothetical protein PULV_a4063 [Pseudoalteromonas ulvae UL12]|uniref:hypothetical protein n=1 Tax=Pseudoalteromonas ulvae TaxID=107327 RepID=UPI00186B8876|nr:hypothetical protein [Pseudoalteromonas ulvae]MBE0362246.1 hypothetical protein [Pseudoalteromonas ulvae UL12]
MKKVVIFAGLSLLMSSIAMGDEVKLSSSKFNMQAFTTEASLIGIDKSDFNDWKNKINRFGNHNGDIGVLLEVQQEIARFSSGVSKYELQDYDFDKSVDDAIRNGKIKVETVESELLKVTAELNDVNSAINDYETKQKENDDAIAQAKADYEKSKVTFREQFSPTDLKAKKKFEKSLGKDSIFKVVKVKEAQSTDCSNALYLDAGTSKSKLKKLNEMFIGQGKQFDKYLYCPTLEFKWIRSKDRSAYKSHLSKGQVELANSILTHYLRAEYSKLAKVHLDVDDKEDKGQYAKSKRSAGELQRKIDQLNRDKLYLSNLSRDDLVVAEKKKLIKVVNNALFTLAELTFSELDRTTSAISADGHIKYEREKDLYFVVYKSGAYPAYYAKLHEDMTDINIDNSVDVIGLLRL